MKYTLEDRMDIGRRIYEGEITRYEAAGEYGISDGSARDYMRLYRDTNHLPPKNTKEPHRPSKVTMQKASQNLEDLEAMTKDELIKELVKARITEAC